MEHLWVVFAQVADADVGGASSWKKGVHVQAN